MSRPLVIGLSGFAQSGKTAAANFIEQTYGVQRRHIAEPLRNMLRVLLRANGLDEVQIDRYLTGDWKELHIPEIGCTSRHLQVTLGTQWGREQVCPDLWVNTWAAGVGLRESVMNDSVRFPNEERMIQGGMLGFTILIRRPGVGPAVFKWGWFGRLLYRWFRLMWGVHDSERVDRLRPDYVIDNDGTLEDLHEKIGFIVEERLGASFA